LKSTRDIHCAISVATT